MKSVATRKNGPRTKSVPLGKSLMIGYANAMGVLEGYAGAGHWK